MDSFFRSKHFILLMATLMGFSAFMIDSILPAFPQMTAFYRLANKNDIQQVVFIYFVGYASTQLLFGLLGDWLGRRATLALGLLLYIGASAALIVVVDFRHLLLARFLQGAGLAAPRVIVNAVVRDVATGNRMAQIMSYITMVFMAVPVLAPTFGQFILKLGDFKTIFYFYLLTGLLVLGWFLRVLPETLAPEKRRPLQLSKVKEALRIFGHNPSALLYLFINALLFSMLASYISQAEPIFARDVYHLGDRFPYLFSSVASGIILAALFNSWAVMRFGMRRMLDGALLGLLLIDGLIFLLTLLGAGKPPLLLLVPLLAGHFIFYSLAMNNLNALLMQPFASIAGVASAVAGTIMTIGGVLIGVVSASQFDGSVYPLAAGFLFGSALSFCLNLLAHRLG